MASMFPVFVVFTVVQIWIRMGAVTVAVAFGGILFFFLVKLFNLKNKIFKLLFS